MAFYAYYFALYAQVAIGISFMPLWLQSSGLSVQDVGSSLALASVLSVIINPMVGRLADRTRQGKAILLVLIITAICASALLQFAGPPLMVAGVFLLLRFVSAPLIPLSESILIANLTKYGLEFGRVRALGSVAVVVTTLLCGYLVDVQGTAVTVVILCLILALQAGLATALPNGAREKRLEVVGQGNALRNRGFLLLVGSASISQACHGVFYAYSTFRWVEAGHSTFSIGMFWALGVGAEIIAFSLGRRMTAKFKAGAIIALACLCGALRWGIFAVSADLAPTIVMQVLQGGTLGLTQIGVAAYLRQNVPSHALSSATGSYAGACAVFSGAFILAAGQLYAINSALVFAGTSAMCCVATVVALLLVRRKV